MNVFIASDSDVVLDANRDRAIDLAVEVLWSTTSPMPLSPVTAKPRRKRRSRHPTLSSVARQVAKAGIEVARYEVEDGRITVVTGKPSGVDNDTEFNEWDAEFNGTAPEIH